MVVADRTCEHPLDEVTVPFEHLQPVDDPDPPLDEQFDGGFPLQPDDEPDPLPDEQFEGGLPLQPDDDPLPLVQVGGGVVELVPVHPV